MKIENSKLKIAFFGTPDFAIPALNSLVNFGYNIVAVVTQPEKPVGRARVITPSPVKKFALGKNIEVFEPHNLKQDEEFFKKFSHLKPDICVVAAYGKILPKRYLEVPKHGFINIHPSFLPKYRGPSPIQTAILNGEDQTGISIMLMDEEVDRGPILASREFSILNFQFSNHDELAKELFKLGAELLIETLPKYINGEIKPVPQNHSQATFTKMFTREDGRINWSDPPEKIYNQIRALNPEPGTWSVWRLAADFVWPKADSVEPTADIALRSEGRDQSQRPRIINIKSAELENGKLQLKTIQMEGKKEVPFREFLNGYPDFNISQLK